MIRFFLWLSCLCGIVCGKAHIRETESEVHSDALLNGAYSNQYKNPAHTMYDPSSIQVAKSRKQSLPSFSNGGIVFFVHIPKTGGTTIRRNFEKLERINYIFGKNYSAYEETAPLVEDAILNGTPNNTILFYEIHATDAPSFFRLRKRLRRWRDTAARNNVSVFFFTVLRDPISYAFSHFNFFHVQRRNPTFERCNATQENFLRLSLSNPQCQFLFKGEPSMRAQNLKQIYVKPEDCEEVNGLMVELLDWVGTTENLSSDTLSLLARLFQLPADRTFNKYRVTKDSGNFFGIENVTASALDHILSLSPLDSKLYEYAKKNFPYSMWT